MRMNIRTWGEEFRVTTVCIDTYSNTVPTGRFYNACLPEGRRFQSLAQFLQEMEHILDTTDFPKAFSEVRTFAPPAPTPRQACPTQQQTGKLATFAIRILFRQNMSWQGTVTWLEGQQEQSFRSVLELILLICNALSYQEAS